MKNKKKPQPLKKAVSQPKAKKNDSATGYYLAAAFLVVATIIAFFPCVNNGFSYWDDPTYIVNNPLIREMTLGNIKRIFSEVYFINYAPLHLFSYMIEYHFFGLSSSGYHWVSLFMHIVNVLLVLAIGRFISNNNIIAFFTALLFAVTPMHVESVAWASERKDMLYSMFFFAGLLSYLNYVKKDMKPKYLVLSMIFFLLSVFSKTMAVSLVPVLFLVDYLYRRKWNAKILLEKIPFILISLLMGIIAVKAQSGSIDTSDEFTFLDRIFFACQNLLMYAGKLIVPVNLSCFYAYPLLEKGHIPINFYISSIGIVILAILILWSMRKGRLVFFGAGFFVATVALVLMIIPVGPNIFSERYSYIPSVMLYYVICYYLFTQIAKKNSRTWMITTSVALAIVNIIFIQITRERCTVWKNDISQLSDWIKNNPKFAIAYNNRGEAYKILNQYDPAIADFRKAISLRPELDKAYSGLCEIYGTLGNLDSALYYANHGLEIKPDLPSILNNRGIIRSIRNNTDSAMMDYNYAIQLQPEFFEAYTNRGILYNNLGNSGAALKDFESALKYKPDFQRAIDQREKLLNNKK